MSTEEKCPHGDTPRHACLSGEHQCASCGMVSGHTNGCPVLRASMTAEQLARFEESMETTLDSIRGKS